MAYLAIVDMPHLKSISSQQLTHLVYVGKLFQTKVCGQKSVVVEISGAIHPWSSELSRPLDCNVCRAICGNTVWRRPSLHVYGNDTHVYLTFWNQPRLTPWLVFFMPHSLN